MPSQGQHMYICIFTCIFMCNKQTPVKRLVSCWRGVHDFQQSTWAFQQDVDLDLVRSDSQVPDESDDTPLFTHRCCVRNSLTPGARLSCVLLGRVMWDTLCHESCVLSSSPHTPDETKAADVCELPPGCAPLPSGRPCGGAPRQEQQGHWGAKQARAELREVHASAQRARPPGVCAQHRRPQGQGRTDVSGIPAACGEGCICVLLVSMPAVCLLHPVHKTAYLCFGCRCQRRVLCIFVNQASFFRFVFSQKAEMCAGFMHPRRSYCKPVVACHRNQSTKSRK